MVHQVQHNHVAIPNRVEQTMERWEVDAVKVGHPILARESTGNRLWGDDFPPLTIALEAGYCSLETLPDRLRRLLAFRGFLSQLIKPVLGSGMHHHRQSVGKARARLRASFQRPARRAVVDSCCGSIVPP